MTKSKTFYAMVVTRCVVAGEVTGSIDVSALMVKADTEDEVRAKLESALPTTYENSDGETVEWPLARIASIDECYNLESGGEVTGFIFQRDDFDELV